MISHITDEERVEIARSQSFLELRSVAMKIINRMPDSIIMVCGPITTGGLGSKEENLKRFARAIHILQKGGFNVFSQLAFERAFFRISCAYNGNGYCWPVLHEFYRPVFRSDKVKALFFLPDWESSTGASWEHQEAADCGVDIVHLGGEWKEL